MNKPAEDPIQDETEKSPESSHPDVENTPDDPPLLNQETEAAHMDIDPMSHDDNPPSPTKGADDDVVVTGIGYTSPGNPTALSKHSAKDELSAMDKGKWKTDLSSYAHLNAQDIHSGFLNRLYTSRDYEAGLVGLMKERYEVTINPFCINICSL